MVFLYDACDQISDFCHQQLLRKMQRKISWTDGRTEGRTEGRTDRGKTVYSPPPSGSGGIKRSLNEIPIGSNGKLLLPCGGHLGYAIGTKLTNLVEDHPVIISIMLQFHHLTRRFSKFHQSEHIIGPGSHVGFPICTKIEELPMNISARFGPNLFCGFREEDENMKSLQTRTTTTDTK